MEGATVRDEEKGSCYLRMASIRVSLLDGIARDRFGGPLHLHHPASKRDHLQNVIRSTNEWRVFFRILASQERFFVTKRPFCNDVRFCAVSIPETFNKGPHNGFPNVLFVHGVEIVDLRHGPPWTLHLELLYPGV